MVPILASEDVHVRDSKELLMDLLQGIDPLLEFDIVGGKFGLEGNVSTLRIGNTVAQEYHALYLPLHRIALSDTADFAVQRERRSN